MDYMSDDKLAATKSSMDEHSVCLLLWMWEAFPGVGLLAQQDVTYMISLDITMLSWVGADLCEHRWDRKWCPDSMPSWWKGTGSEA